MPLSSPAPREPLHTRRIECRGYRRADGLWDIEGHLVDTKTYAFSNRHRGEIVPGVPLHEMWIRLTLDERMTVKAVEAVTDAGPFPICGDIAPAFRKLEGLTIGPGWNKKVKELVGGVAGCTHIVELLGPVGTTAYQTIGSDKADELSREHWHKELAARGESPPPRRKPEVSDYRAPSVINTCHAWAEDSPVMKRWSPLFYTGPGREKVRADAEARVEAGLPPEA